MVKPSATDLIIDTISNDKFNHVQSYYFNFCNKPVLGNQKIVAYQCSQCTIWTNMMMLIQRA